MSVADETNGYRGTGERLFRREMDRARFLRLIGAGATLPFIPTALGARPSEAQATPTPEILSEEGEYPIGVWTPPPPSKTTRARYGEIAAAGFNFVIGGNGVTSGPTPDDPTDLHQRALDAAAANNLRFLITDNILQNAVNGEISPDRQEDVTKRIERLLKRYGPSPAMAGLNMYDEPNSRLFGILAHARRELQRLAPGELPYVNVWPSYAAPRALGARTYRRYVNRYLNTVSPPLLSFDHYPLLSKGITSDYFFNWAVIRNFSREFGVPSWGFIQSVGFDGRRVGLARRRTPDKNEIFWQINVGLAYGARGIQYFTYWTPDDPKTKFNDALITRNGEFTPRYRYATEANDYLKKVGKKLLPLKSESVVHARVKRLPRGAQPFKADNWVRAVGGSPVILGRFSNPDAATEQYLLVVNRSSAKTAITQLTMSDSVSKVYKLNIKTGEFGLDPVNLQGSPPRILRVKLGPGRATLYRLQTS
jgi:hypothetical protein